MTKKTSTDNMIKNLASHAEDIVPIKGPYFVMLRMQLVSWGYILLCILVYGVRSDIAQKLSQGWYLAELCIAVIGAVVAAYHTALVAVPDCYQKKRHASMSLIALLVLLGILWKVSGLQQDTYVPITTNSYQCAMDMCILSLLPLLVAFVTLRRAATTHSMEASISAGLMAVYVAYFGLRVIEGNDDVVHLLLWHILPMLLVIFLSVLVGRRFLKW